MEITKTLALFVVTAVAEIVGCWLPYLWLRQHGSPWLLLSAALSLCCFVWLLSIHPTATGRVYAAYGAIYICTAIAWLWLVDGVKPTHFDWIGLTVCLLGASIIIYGAKNP